MKNMQKTMKRIGFFLGLFILLLPLPVLAQENSGSIQIKQLDTDTNLPVQGVKLALYKIADKNESSSYTITESFKNLGIEPEALCDGEKCNQNVSYLEEYLEKNHPDEISEKVSDPEGTIVYEGLSDGIYFIKQVNSQDDFDKLGYSYETDSYLVVLPGMDENGCLTRTIYCKPKGKIKYPTENQPVIVYKVWKDDNNKLGKRPANITVGLYCDGVLQEKVLLSAVNNWTYQWNNLDLKKAWSVKEIDIPEGYSSEIMTEGHTYTITNKLMPPETPKSYVDTGDTTNIVFYIVLFIDSLLLLLGIGVVRKRHKK